MKKFFLFLTLLTLSVGQMWGAIASGTYVLCTSTSDLEANAHYIIANGTSGTVKCISNVSNNNNRKTVEATVSSSKITVAANSTIMTFTLGGSSGSWTFHTDNYAGTDGYLASASNDKNYCRVISTVETATISFSNNVASITLTPHSSRKYLKYNANNGDPLFACYSSGQSDVYLYKKEAASGYSITYHCNGATSGCPSDATGQTKLPATLPTPSRTGCTFAGWFTNEALTSAATAGATLSANADLYAKWTCNVTLNRNGVADNTHTNVAIGTTLASLQGEGNQGGCTAWTFLGWSKTQRAAQDNSDAMTLVTTVDGPGPYYAVYKHVEGSSGSSSETFTFSDIADANNWENSVAYTTVKIGDVTILAQGGGNNGKWYTSSGGSWRMYSGGTVSISSTAGDVISVTSSPSCEFTISDGVATFSPSARTDFTEIEVEYEGGSTTYYSTTATCCTSLGQINGSVSEIHPTSAKIIWNNVANVSSWTLQKKASSDQDYSDVWASKTGSDSEITIYSAGGTNNKCSTEVVLSCGTVYSFKLIANPASGHCDASQVLDNSGSGYNSGQWTVTSTGVTNATASPAIPAATCSGFSTTITAATGYALPENITVTNADKTWNKSTGALGVSSVTGNVAITITPTAHNYTITYNNMDGATNHVNNPATYKITDSDITLGTPTKDGWTFEGWFNNSDLAEEHKVTDVAIAAGSHENKTFYAKWVHKVTLSKASVSHGSFVLSSSNTGSPEISSVNTSSAATVYVVCTPDDGYEVSSVSQSDIAAGNVTIGGNGNARTIEYAQGSNGASEVSVAFSCVQPSISVQPASANYAQNAVATALTVTASANNASLGYLWQSSTDNTNWSAAAGTNNLQSYTPSTATANTTYYRVVVTNNATDCSVSKTSDVATIIVSASVCATPQLSVATGTYNTNQSVTISCATEGATIRYTTNGDEPTESSPEYSGAISVEVSQTIKAKAFKSEWTASNTASATYTLQCATPEFDKGTNTYLGQQDITLSCATTGASIYYTLDDSTPSSTNGTEYTGAAITVSTNQTIKMIAVKDGWSDSEIDYATYTIQYTVTWNDNSGQVHSQAVTYGSDVYSCPSDPGVGGDNCGDKFMGWTTNPTYKGNSAPPVLFTNTSGEKPAIIGNTNFYAVFADFAE